MANIYEIPTSPGEPFVERVTILGITYTLYFCWNWVAQCWTLDWYDETTTIPLLRGMPVVTGCDLLEQYQYMRPGWNTVLTALTIGPDVSPDTVPTFDNLGTDGHLYVTTP
jgi:hypothetical protein